MFGIFRQAVTVKRKPEGEWVNGFWVDGVELEPFTIQASAQPASSEDMQLLPGGKRSQGAYKIFTDAFLIVGKEGSTQQADRVVIGGQEFEIVKGDVWANNILPHNEYLASRVQL